jgi:hypothetical protein
MFDPITPLYFFLGAMLYLFPRAGVLVIVGIVALASLGRR